MAPTLEARVAARPSSLVRASQTASTGASALWHTRQEIEALPLETPRRENCCIILAEIDACRL